MDSSADIYLDVMLEFESSAPHVEETMFEGIVTLALKQLHGDVGAAMAVDLVMYNPGNLQGVLRVQQSDLVKLWSALTLYGYYESQRCAFTVRKEPSDFIPPKEFRKLEEAELGGCG
eukprot:XP_011669349.1 PREDICTED: ribonuclease P protein subunit p14 isoform X2 [Strongylocentrotus purpuratus]